MFASVSVFSNKTAGENKFLIEKIDAVMQMEQQWEGDL